MLKDELIVRQEFHSCFYIGEYPSIYNRASSHSSTVVRKQSSPDWDSRDCLWQVRAKEVVLNKPQDTVELNN